MTGNGFAQLFALLISPILSRLFTPSEIGIYAFLLGIVNIFTVISSGRYEQAIVVSKTDKEAINVLALGVSLVSIMSAISFLIVLILISSNFQFFEGQLNEKWAYSIPIVNFLLSFYLLLRYYAIRKKSFKYISISMPAESIVKGLASIGFGWYIGGAWGLIIATIFGAVSSIITLYKGISESIKENIKYIEFSDIKRLARVHYKFPAYDAPNALLYSFSQQGILIFIPKLFSERIAGIYSYTNRILLTPVRFFAGSYSQVMYQKLSEIRENNEYYFELIAKSTNRIFYLFAIPFALFVYTSKYYVPFVFGDEWVDLYKLMYILSPYSMMVLISPAFTNVFIIDNKQDISLKLKVVFIVLRLGILFLGAAFNWEILFVFTLFSAGSTFSMLLNFFVYYRLNKRNMPHSIYSIILVSVIVYYYLFIFFI